MAESIKFQTWSSFVDMGFWHEYSKRKLEIYKLKDDPIEIIATFQPGNSKLSDSLMNLDLDSFNVDSNISKGRYVAPGTIYQTNTIEDFQKFDRKKVFNQEVEKVKEFSFSKKKNEEKFKLNENFNLSKKKKKNFLFIKKIKSLIYFQPFFNRSSKTSSQVQPKRTHLF